MDISIFAYNDPIFLKLILYENYHMNPPAGWLVAETLQSNLNSPQSHFHCIAGLSTG